MTWGFAECTKLGETWERKEDRAVFVTDWGGNANGTLTENLFFLLYIACPPS